MTYLVIRETCVGKLWFFAFIGIVEFDNIPKKFKFDDIYNIYYKNLKNIDEHNYQYFSYISLLSINDIDQYLFKIKSILKDSSWPKYIKEYLKTNYPEIYLILNIERI